MSASLRDVRDQRGEVVAVAQLGGGMVEVSARLPHLAAVAKPGQFAQLRCGGSTTPLLRRPFSVAWTKDDVASFVLAPVGAGTRRLAALRPGEPLDALGPLGQGFTVSGSTRALCVCGGLGCAPFPLLIRALRRAGTQTVTVVSGAASAARLYPPAGFARGDPGVHVEQVTEDGSRGRRGLVTDAVPAHLGGASTAVYACGPTPMMVALARILQGSAAPPIAQVSLEAPMGCGYGTCLGCALPVRGADGPAWALCCREGPVMDVETVDWDELMTLPPAHVA